MPIRGHGISLAKRWLISCNFNPCNVKPRDLYPNRPALKQARPAALLSTFVTTLPALQFWAVKVYIHRLTNLAYIHCRLAIHAPIWFWILTNMPCWPCLFDVCADYMNVVASASLRQLKSLSKVTIPDRVSCSNGVPRYLRNRPGMLLVSEAGR